MFETRRQAGEKLIPFLQSFHNLSKIARDNFIILAIPRGGVVVGKAISQNLKKTLSLLVTRKITPPDNPELAIGAVGPDKIRIINWELVSRLNLSRETIDTQTKKAIAEVEERQKKWGQKTPKVTDKKVILVDDGIATGATVQAAIAWLKSQKPKSIILAVPVASPETVIKLEAMVDKMIVLESPADFSSVGQFYKSFPQVSDEEVAKLLKS